MHYPLQAFLADSETVIRSTSDEGILLRRLKPLMQKLVLSPGSVPDEALASGNNRFANNLIFRPGDRAFSVMGGNWQPGQSTPIHDHLTWAVVGVLEGEERESIFRRTDDGSVPGRAALDLVTERSNPRGHVTVLGRAGIHRIDNVTSAPSLSVHMYGRDIGATERHSYDPQTGTVSKFVSGYCNVLRDEE